MRARGDGYVLERKRGGKASGKWYVRLPWTHGVRRLVSSHDLRACGPHRRSWDKSSLGIVEARDVAAWFRHRIGATVGGKVKQFRKAYPDADEVEFTRTRARVSAGRTCNRYKAFLSEFFKWAAQQGLVDEMLFDRIPKGLPRYSEENDFGVILDAQAEGGSEIQILEAAMPADFRPLVTLGVLTGLREGEIADLRWSQVNFARCEITVSAAGSKGKRVKTVRLPLKANRLLRELRAGGHSEGHVFLTPEGVPWRDERISRTFSRVVRAGVKGLSARVCREMRFHDLRHTCAVTMLRGGASLHEVRDQLGHSSIQVTEQYAKYVLGSTERAAAAMDRMMASGHERAGVVAR